ncbi:NAD(P)-binding protein [Daedaleopsis nitida]|nr:NAD(P)-binding protein [Daedaleopsis nitida]
MPAVTSGKVLVTGANGFVAGWITKTLLEHGFSVRATVRSPGKADPIGEALSAHREHLEFAVVKDITQASPFHAGAFDEAIVGVDAIVHAASPVILTAYHPDELIRPAVEGTLSILRSASSPHTSVQRVIFVSSLSTCVNNHHAETPPVFDETDWNDRAPAEVEAKGVEASAAAKYATSKTLAEKAAWEYVKRERGRGTVRWDFVSLCPPWVFGPMLGARTPEDLTSSVEQWYKLAIKEEGDRTVLGDQGPWADARDFADATLAALTKPEAGGERFVISAGLFTWKLWVAQVRRILGKPFNDISEEVVFDAIFDSKKSRAVLGIQYRSMEETARFVVEDLRARGWC